MAAFAVVFVVGFVVAGCCDAAGGSGFDAVLQQLSGAGNGESTGASKLAGDTLLSSLEAVEQLLQDQDASRGQINSALQKHKQQLLSYMQAEAPPRTAEDFSCDIHFDQLNLNHVERRDGGGLDIVQLPFLGGPATPFGFATNGQAQSPRPWSPSREFPAVFNVTDIVVDSWTIQSGALSPLYSDHEPDTPDASYWVCRRSKEGEPDRGSDRGRGRSNIEIITRLDQ